LRAQADAVRSFSFIPFLSDNPLQFKKLHFTLHILSLVNGC